MGPPETDLGVTRDIASQKLLKTYESPEAEVTCTLSTYCRQVPTQVATLLLLMGGEDGVLGVWDRKQDQLIENIDIKFAMNANSSLVTSSANRIGSTKWSDPTNLRVSAHSCLIGNIIMVERMRRRRDYYHSIIWSARRVRHVLARSHTIPSSVAPPLVRVPIAWLATSRHWQRLPMKSVVSYWSSDPSRAGDRTILVYTTLRLRHCSARKGWINCRRRCRQHCGISLKKSRHEVI
jgi:hypothetical protein